MQCSIMDGILEQKGTWVEDMVKSQESLGFSEYECANVGFLVLKKVPGWCKVMWGKPGTGWRVHTQEPSVLSLQLCFNLKLTQIKHLFTKCKRNISQEQQLHFFPSTLSLGRTAWGRCTRVFTAELLESGEKCKNCNRMTQETMDYLHYETAYGCEKWTRSICTEKI